MVADAVYPTPFPRSSLCLALLILTHFSLPSCFSPIVSCVWNFSFPLLKLQFPLLETLVSPLETTVSSAWNSWFHYLKLLVSLYETTSIDSPGVKGSAKPGWYKVRATVISHSATTFALITVIPMNRRIQTNSESMGAKLILNLLGEIN